MTWDSAFSSLNPVPAGRYAADLLPRGVAGRSTTRGCPMLCPWTIRRMALRGPTTIGRDDESLIERFEVDLASQA